MLGEQGEAIGVYYRLGQFFRDDCILLDSAAWYAQRCFDLASTYDSVRWQGHCKRLESSVALRQDNPRRVKEAAQAAIRYYTLSNDSTKMVRAKINLAAAYRRLGALDRSLAINLEANRYFEKQRDWSNLTISLNNTGIVYNNLNNPKKAEVYYRKVLTICDSTGNVEGSLRSLQNLGNALVSQENYQGAIALYLQAIERATILDNRGAVEYAYNGLGYTHYLMGNPERAITYAEQSMGIFDQEAFRGIDANNLHTIGMAHLALGNIKQAEEHLRLALSITEENGFTISPADFQKGLYTLYAKIGDHQRALSYLEDYLATQEKINSSTMNADVSEVEAEFLAQEKAQALEEVEAQHVADEKRFKKTINYVSASLVAVSLILLVFFQRHKIILARNHQQLSENKFASLRAQMNPHFIFNTINGVQNHILKADKMRAYQHLNRFADTLRLMLSNADQPFVNLSVERQLLEHYILLEQERFANRFCYRLRIDDTLLDYNPLIPSMVLQPVVENAIIHGLSNREEPGTLLVDIQWREKTVLCVIEDDGIGREAALRNKQARVNKHLSMASKNTHERIALLRKFGYERSRLTIEDLYDPHGSACGTRVVVELPLKTTTND